MQKVMAFDMFPHTEHCELMIEFVRAEDFVEPPQSAFVPRAESDDNIKIPKETTE